MFQAHKVYLFLEHMYYWKWSNFERTVDPATVFLEEKDFSHSQESPYDHDVSKLSADSGSLQFEL